MIVARRTKIAIKTKNMGAQFQAFIVRPFGKRKVIQKDKDGNQNQVEFNFDKVQEKLIDPAFVAAKLEGGTTGKIFEAGSIHEDMFTQLLMAELVIADVSIHNANVFYELGIRHALRDKQTVLIRGTGFDEIPFDIVGYKYISYDKEDPAASLSQLIQAIEETRQANKQDSPVFKMLPKLQSQDAERFMAVPVEFNEEVKVACDTKQVGRLLLMASEVDTCSWHIPGYRLIGEALFGLKALDAGRMVWEKIKDRLPNDRLANDRLATIYQRLAEREMIQNRVEGTTLLALSDISIDKLLSDYGNLNKQERAEAYSLKGRNTKTKWMNSWKEVSSHEKGSAAVQSDYLETAYKQYERGYYENLNHFYAGINALSLLTIMIALAETYPGQWELKFKRQRDADQELEELKERKESLSVSVQTSIEAEQRRLEITEETDVWLNITEADFTFLTEDNPARITAMYRSALLGTQNFHHDAARRQVEIFEQLGILSTKVQAALTAIPTIQSVNAQVPHYLLFTGHMIDKPGRAESRFPAQKEAAVKRKIKEIIEEEKSKADGNYRGISGGACGGDILFHEACAELGIQTELYLAVPREQFIVESVQFAGQKWVERLNHLYSILPHQILSQKQELPQWLQGKKDYSIWERNNLWMLNGALSNGGLHMTLIALWDGKGGDSAGGTEHMVKEAMTKGAVVRVIDMKEF
jgi:hypothetical protein